MARSAAPDRPFRVGVVASTGGAVYASCCQLDSVRERIALVMADRDCGAVRAASGLGLESLVAPWTDRDSFSDRVLKEMGDRGVDLVVCFFTRLLGGALLEAFAGRIVNFHPSILPAFAGFHALDRAIASGAKLIGSSVHLIDHMADGGPLLLQAACPLDPSLTQAQVRHLVFVQQCKSLIQIIDWYESARVLSDRGRAWVAAGRYEIGEFSPNLDSDAAIGFSPEPPSGSAQQIQPPR